MPGVVSVRIEFDADDPIFRVKLARDISDEQNIKKLARDCCNLERISSFENEDRQLVIRFFVNESQP